MQTFVVVKAQKKNNNKLFEGCQKHKKSFQALFNMKFSNFPEHCFEIDKIFLFDKTS
jgi:hypothetical protein